MKRSILIAAAAAVIIVQGLAQLPEARPEGPVVLSILLDSGECIPGPLVQIGPGEWVKME